MAGVLSPDARLRIFSDLGLISAGAKLNTYVTGTTTPLATYSDAGLSVPNANPVVASAGGLFGPIYLTPGVAYKYVLTDAAGNPIWSQDPVTATGLTVAALTNHGVALGTGTEALNSTSAGTAGQVLTSNGASADPTFQLSGSNGVQDFRLTLETGVPVSSTDQTAKGTLFATPYTGNRITLFSASGVPTVVSSAEFSIAVPAVANQMYDVFAFNNAGVATLELLAWTNDTTRATALVRTTTGALAKSGDLTRRYLGSFRTTAVVSQTEDSLVKRYVWNYYNRARRPLLRIETTDSWNYTNTAYQQANAAAANQVDVVVGIAETLLSLRLFGYCTNSAGSLTGQSVAIGEDSTTTAVANQLIHRAIDLADAATRFRQPQAALDKYPAIGRHFYAWLENSTAAGTTTWYGDNGTPTSVQSGLSGFIEG